MADYSHVLFSRELNRNRTKISQYVKNLNPGRQAEQPDEDPKEPYRVTHIGLFGGSVKDNEGKDREYVFYVPESMESAGNLVFIFTDQGKTAKEAFRAYDWPRILEENETTGIFMAPDGDWNRENPGNDLDCFLRIYEEAFDQQYFIPTETGLYSMGFGSGAYMSALVTILYGSKFSSFAVNGECGFTDELLELLADLPSDGDDTVKKGECPLPAWIIDGSESGGRLVDFMKRANRSEEAMLSNDVARVWFPKVAAGELYINSQNVNQVWYSEKAPLGEEETAARMMKFVVSFRRWGGYGNGHIRYARTAEEMGLIRKDIVVDGLNRRFYVYEPSSYRKGEKKEWPLVLAIHGFTATARYFAENSSWQAVAEDRGFLLVFPSGYPHVTRRVAQAVGHRGCPPPSWNSSLACMDDEAQNEIHYFERLLQTVKEEYSVDPARIYVSGHSNGSEMTQYLMRYMPRVFAAFAPVGAMGARIGKDVVPMPEDGVIRPVWYVMGEYDLQDAWDLTPGGGNAQTLENMCACNQADYEGTSRYINGIYHHMVAYNEERIPLVRFTGIEKWPHTVTPETSLMIWDDFFCKFRRKEDGTIVYVG